MPLLNCFYAPFYYIYSTYMEIYYLCVYFTILLSDYISNYLSIYPLFYSTLYGLSIYASISIDLWHRAIIHYKQDLAVYLCVYNLYIYPKRVEEQVRLNCCTQKVYCVGVWCKQYKWENRRWLRQREQRADMGVGGLGLGKILQTVWWKGER